MNKLKELIEEYENPFVGKRFFGHEECYKEIEKFRKYVLKILN